MGKQEMEEHLKRAKLKRKVIKKIRSIANNTCGKKIDLDGNKLGPEGAKAIAEALKSNTTLQTIDLEGNNLGPEGARAIAEALKTNTTLQWINLEDNGLGPEGARAIAEALKTNTTLQLIDLEDNGLGPEGARAIAEALKTNTTLQLIDLASNNLRLEGGKAVAEALKTNTTVQEISLAGNNLGPEGARAIAEALKTNTTLQLIELQDNGLGPEGGKAIAEALDPGREIKVVLDGDAEEAFKAVMEEKRKNPNRARQTDPKPAPQARPHPSTSDTATPSHTNTQPKEHNNHRTTHHQHQHQHRAFATVQAAIRSGQCQMFGRSKVMAVGEGRKGKTTLLNSLMAKPFEEHQHSTQGSATTDLAVTVDTKDVFQWQEMKDGVSEAVRAAGSAAMAESSRMDAKWRKQGKHELELRKHRAKERQAQQQKAEREQRRSQLKGLFSLSRAAEKRPKAQSPTSQATATANTPSLPQSRVVGSTDPRAPSSGSQDSDEEPVPAPADPISAAEVEAAIKDLQLDAVMGEGKAQVTFKLFDLGGQSTFYIFHPFFLTKYAIYLLVFSMEDVVSKDKQTQDGAWHFIEHWLTSLHLHAPGAPILMVGTFGDQVASRRQHEAISKDVAQHFRTNPAFPDLVHNASSDLWFWPVNNTQSIRDPVVQDLQATISSTALKQEHVQMQVPLSFLRLYDELTRQHREENKPFLRLDEVVRIAQRFGLRDRSEAIEALQFLHLYSMLLYYDHVPGMDQVVILSPQWTVDMLCRIVRNFELHRVPMDAEACRLGKAWQDLVERGVLHRNMLEVLWQDLDADLLDPLLDLMMRYGLCVHYTPPRLIGAGHALKPTTGHSAHGKPVASDSAPTSRYVVPAILGMALDATDLDANAKEGLSTAAAQRLHTYQGPEPKTAYLSFFLEDFKEEGSVRLKELPVCTFLPEGLFTRLLAHMMVHTQQEATSRPELSRTHARMYPGDNLLELQLVPNVGGIKVTIDSPHPRPLLNLVRDTVLQALEQHYQRLGCHVLLPHSKDTLLFFDDVLYHHKDKRNIRVQGKRVTAPQLAERFGPLLPRLGLQSQYDVFLSYRQTANSGYVTTMHRLLERKELGVFLDANNLETGLNFKLSFMEAIGRSLVACPVVSAGALQRMQGLHEEDYCDNVLLEWMTMLALDKYGRTHRGDAPHELIRLQRVVPLFLGSAWLDANALANIASKANSFGDIKALAQQLPDRVSEGTTRALNAYFEEILHLPTPQSMSVRGVVLALMDMDGRMSFAEGRANVDLRQHAEDVRKAATTAREKQHNQSAESIVPAPQQEHEADITSRDLKPETPRNDAVTTSALSKHFQAWLADISMLHKVGPALVTLGVDDFEHLQLSLDMGEEFTHTMRAQGVQFATVAKLKWEVSEAAMPERHVATSSGYPQPVQESFSPVRASQHRAGPLSQFCVVL